MNKNIFLVVFAIITGLLLGSCEKETAKPVIDILELGLGNSHKAYIGSDLHIEADIVAEGLIGMVKVEVHAEDGSSNEIEEEFDYSDQTLKNTTFHKHVEIPDDFPTGEYHFHLTVTDKEGNATSVEDDVEFEELVDVTAPEIIISATPDNAKTYTNGETISISGTITDDNELAGMLVALVYADDNISDTDVTGDNSKVIVMLHTHDFDEHDETNFTATIEVGAAYDNNMTPAAIVGDNAWKSGNYYILVKSIDAKGNWGFSAHQTVTISL